MRQPQKYWTLFLQGDDRALGDLYHVLFEPMVFVAYHRVKNMEHARDIVSELFVSLLATSTEARRMKWQNVESIQAYLTTAVKNKAIDYLRTKKSHVEILTLLPQEHAQEQETDMSILEELIHYPKKETELFQLHLDGYSNTEIAEKKMISEKTVRNKLSMTRRKMALHYKSFLTLALWMIAH
jgi:RNA polymerase sigma factor (sigma-70 family)